MSLEKLKEEQMQLVLRRSEAKDVVENCEKGLGAISLAIQVLEAQNEDEVPAPE